MTAVAVRPVRAVALGPGMSGGCRLIPEYRYARSSETDYYTAADAAMALAYLQTAPRPG